ncbi:MAG TPA: protein kinase [Polyangiaceae bacterium]|jgi:serine/threonine-protein kinase
MSREGTDARELDRLTSFGSPGGATTEEVLRAFAYLRTTPHEHRAVDWLIARNARTPLPDALLVALASALLDRGDAAGAERVIAPCTSSAALVLRSDLSALAGDIETASALVERVLARDVDSPGARERYARLRGRLGRTDPKPLAREAPIAPRTVDAPFELVREVGRGAAGAVFEAKDRALGRTVALKVYHRPDRDGSQLLHEARVASAIAGPGVIRVFDVHPRHGWLAMEWAALGALGALLHRGERATPPVDVWAPPLARALVRVHEAGWVHHDVKPANVLLRSAGDPILGDFGVARRPGEPASPGSRGYVSPERQAGSASDVRDDVYGFGRILEDALAASASREEAEPWRALARACTGPADGRPLGAALLAWAGVRD